MRTLIVILILLSQIACTNHKPEQTGFEGKPLPSFNILLSDSITYFDTKQIKLGSPSVLFYFGPDCPFSRDQMDEIVSNIQLLKDVHFYVFTTWPFMQMRNFSKEYELNKYSNITVGVDYTNFFANYYHANGVPFIAIFGNDKRLKNAFMGKVSRDVIKEIADK